MAAAPHQSGRSLPTKSGSAGRERPCHIGNLAASNQPAEISEGPIAPTSFIEAAQTIVGQHDDKFGGFGGAPKFPPSTTLKLSSAAAGKRDR